MGFSARFIPGGRVIFLMVYGISAAKKIKLVGLIHYTNMMIMTKYKI